MSAPYSHRLIGAIVEGLKLRDPDLQSAAARKFFRGQSVRATTRARVLRAFAVRFARFVRATIDGDIVTPPWLARVDRSALVHSIAADWDAWVDYGGTQPAVVDISIRIVGAARFVLQSKDLILALVDEITDRGLGKLRSLTNAGPHERPSHEDIAATCGVSSLQVRRWFAGLQSPSAAKLKLLTGAFADAIRVSRRPLPARTVEQRLVRWFSAQALRRALVRTIGAAVAHEVLAQVRSLVSMLVQRPVSHPADIDAAQVGADGAAYCLFAYGIGSISGRIALELVERHADDVGTRSTATTILESFRRHEQQPAAATFIRDQPFEWKRIPDLLEGHSRLLPSYPKTVAGFALAAKMRGEGHVARKLAIRASKLGEPGPLAAIERAKRRRRP